MKPLDFFVILTCSERWSIVARVYIPPSEIVFLVVNFLSALHHAFPKQMLRFSVRPAVMLWRVVTARSNFFRLESFVDKHASFVHDYFNERIVVKVSAETFKLPSCTLLKLPFLDLQSLFLRLYLRLFLLCLESILNWSVFI